MKNFIRFSIPFLTIILFFACSPENVTTENDIDNNLSKKSKNFPDDISLPDGFNPEGITSGNGTTLYVGSLVDGTILEIDSRTGETTVLVSGQPDKVAVGLDFDSRTGYLFVAGGTDGFAYVYDTDTGIQVAAIQLTTSTFPNAFINDVIVTEDAAYFTNSFAAEYYKIPLNDDGTLNTEISSETIPLTGDFMLVDGFNANGIVAIGDGEQLIIVHSALGELYLTDSETGEATKIDLNGVDVVNGDGLVLRGKKLYVVQNNNNQVSIIKLKGDNTSGELVEVISSDVFRIPTTATLRGNKLYVVNGRFDVAPPPFLGMGYDPTIEFEVVAVDAN